MKIPDPRTQAIVHEKVLTVAELKHLKETFEVREWDATQATTKEEILHQIGLVWDFPPYYGQNWDALVDCLSDLSWIKGNRFAFVIRGFENTVEGDVLLECLGDVSQRWCQQDLVSGFVTILISNPIFTSKS
jgi:RNAse (barnase) inhibitor barstar